MANKRLENMGFPMTHGIIKAFVEAIRFTPIRPISPPCEGEGSASGLFPDENGALPINDARDQWIVDELRKVEGQ